MYSRKVIGYYLGESVETKDLIRLMNNTYKKRKEPNNLIFHSDQGTQYRSFDFKKYLKSKNIKQSFSRKACPYDNSVCESFFSRFKKEEIYRHLFNSEKDLENAIKNYIKIYNSVRPHDSLGGNTPNEFEEKGLIKAKENRQF